MYGLNVNIMSEWYGGKQPDMQDTVLTKNCVGSIEHEHRLREGDTQCFTFQESDTGPFWLSESERESKKYDIVTGEKKR